jgi:diguanylate cyclase (GGDEF)-like protein/PAS domain S-box-containing protein
VDYIKRWLAPPVFQNDTDKTIRSTVIQITLPSVMAFILIAMIGAWLGGRTPPAIITIDAAIVVVCLIFFYWLRQGKIGLVSVGLVTLGIISITIAVASLGTIRTPTTATYLVLVIIAGLLFDLGGIIVMTILCSLAVLGLIAAENAGLLPPPDLSVTITQWITYTALFGSSSGLTIMVLRSLRQTIQHANSEITERKQAESALQVSELQYRTTLDSMNDAIHLVDEKLQIILLNPAFKNWVKPLGLEIELGQNLFDAFPFLPETVRDEYREVFKTGKILVTEETNLLGDQNIVTETRKIPILDGEHVIRIVTIVRDITERKRTEERLAYLGAHDALTSVYNRTFFETELARLAHSREFPVSIVVVDVDDMKIVNDTKGHATGDELLRRTTQVLQSVFRASDILARIGGDEFAILLPNTDLPTVEYVVSRVKEKLAEYNIEHSDLPVHLSLGAATATQGDLADAFKMADRRMYEDKSVNKANK